MTCTTRRPRQQRVYLPHFGNIVNEIFNTPVQEVVRNGNKNVNSPAVNVLTDEDKYLLELAVPGHAKKDINITIDDDLIRIKSNMEATEVEGQFRLREFNYAGFERNFRLPDTVDQTNVEATFKNGVLTLKLHKKEEAKPQPARTVTIK